MEQEKQENKHIGIKIRIKKDTLKWIIIGLAIFVAAVLIFGAGMFVGTIKARFSYRWAENYHRNFGGPQGGFMGDLRMMPPNSEFIESYGTFGQIIKIDSSTGSGQAATLVIKGRNDMEKIVLIKDDTVIKRGGETIKPADLKIDEYIVVIGEPNDIGQITAKLIRILPSGEASFNMPLRGLPL
jgi:hypothetical protein